MSSVAPSVRFARLSQRDDGVLVVGEDAVDVELLSTAGQLEVLDERGLDGLPPLVVAAVGSLAAEVEHGVDGEIGERAVQVRLLECCVGGAHTRHVRMLCHRAP